MKKILRLVTTSVLTLTLVACGEASSSVSNGTQTSSSVSSSVSSFAAVNSITLSAATDVRTQVLGSTKLVVVQATLNANANPNQAIEWFVNDTKSNQTGRVFEYNPNAVGTFSIQAKVGTVLSNKIDVAVSAGSAATLSLGVDADDVSIVNATTLKIVGVGGAKITVAGKTLAASSNYDLAGGFYNVVLTEAFKVGDTAKLTMEKDGYSKFEYDLVFDTRKLEVNVASYDGENFSTTSTKITKATDGAFVIERPYVLNNAGGLNAASNTINVTFKSTDLNTSSGALLTYTLERTSAPAGALPYVKTTGQIEVAANNAGGRSVSFNVTRETPLGDYVFKLNLGVKEITTIIRVEDKVADFKIKNRGTTTAVREVSFRTGAIAAPANKTLSDKVNTVAVDSGVYSIEKSYLKDEFQEFTFTMTAENINVPATLLGTATQAINTNSNQMLMSLSGPGGISFMRASTVTQLPLATPITFRNNLGISASDPAVNGFVVTQRIDETTTAGDYVFTVRILQLGTEIHSKTVTVRVTEPKASFQVMGTVTDPNHLVWEEVLKGTLRDAEFNGIVSTNASTPTKVTGMLSGVRNDNYLHNNSGVYQLKELLAFEAATFIAAGSATTAANIKTAIDTVRNSASATPVTASINDLYYNTTTFDLSRVSAVATDGAITVVPYTPSLGFNLSTIETILGITTLANIDGTFYNYETNRLNTFANGLIATPSTTAEHDAVGNLVFATTDLVEFRTATGVAAGATIVNKDYFNPRTGQLFTGTAGTPETVVASTPYAQAGSGSSITVLGYGNSRVEALLKNPSLLAAGDAFLIHDATTPVLEVFNWNDEAGGTNNEFIDTANNQVYTKLAASPHWQLSTNVSEYIVGVKTSAKNDSKLFKYDNYSDKLVEVLNQPFFVDSFTTLVWHNVTATGWAATALNDTTLIPLASYTGTAVATTAPTLAVGEFWLDITATQIVLKNDTGVVVTGISEGAIFVSNKTTNVGNVYQYDSSKEAKWLPYSKTNKVVFDHDPTPAGLNFEVFTDTNASKDGVFETVPVNNTAATLAALLDSIRGSLPLRSARETADLSTLANPTVATNVASETDGIFFEPVINSSGLSGKLMALKQTQKVINLVKTNGVFMVEKPLRDGFDSLVVNFGATLTNFQSALSPQSGLDVSYAATDGTRALIPFKKSFTSQMTLPNADDLEADTYIGIELERSNAGVGTRLLPVTAFDEDGLGTAGTISNRLTGDSRIFYDLFRSSGATTTMNDLFTLTLNRQTVNGAYTFNLQVGDLSETITVMVENAKPAIEVFAMDLINKKVLAPVAGKYEVTLNNLVNGIAEVAFSTNLVNLRPATASVNYDVAFKLTRDFNGVWQDVKNDNVTAVDKVGNSGDLVASGLNTLLHAEQPSGTDSSTTKLVLDQTGEYKFKLEVGGAVKEFSVVVKSFPTATFVNAFAGVGTVATNTKGTTAVPVVNGYAQVPVGSPAVYLDIRGLNASSVRKYMITDLPFNSAASTGALVTTAGTGLANLTADTTPKAANRALTFNATTGVGTVVIDNTIMNNSAVAQSAGLNTVGIKRFTTVYLYDANNNFVGYAEFAYEVVKPNPALIIDTTADAIVFTTGAGSDGFAAEVVATASAVTNYVTGYTSAAPFIITPGASLVSGTDNLLIEVVNSIARNIVADSVNELPSTLKVAKVIKVVGTTSTEEPDLNITMVNEKFEITYTATDLAGNSKTIFVTLNKNGA